MSCSFHSESGAAIILAESELHSAPCYTCLQVSTDEIESLYKKHSVDQQLLHVFFLLRVALAPVIEAVILLDRLLYLHEQVSYKSAYT
jgi:hypothetical protein